MLDNAPEGVGRDLRAGQQPGFDAEPVEQSQRRGFAVDFGLHLLDGVQHVLQGHLADFALVGTRLGFHDGDAVLFVAGIPGLDGAPGELAGTAFLIGERHLADGPDAGLDTASLGHVNGPEHPHFQVGSGIAHECFFR